MREINVIEIRQAVATLCQEACTNLPEDVLSRLEAMRASETFPMAQKTLDILIENAKVSKEKKMAICQDTGMACIWIKVGQDVHFVGGDVNEAIHQGVSQGYEEGYLRKSIVDDPVFDRVNTKNNTPAAITYEIVPGDQVEITVAPKGFGSENMSQIKMLKPSDGVEGIKSFVLGAIESAGANACPPMIIGVGIGGNFDKVALLAKKAMMAPIESKHADERYAKLEQELLESANQLGIGPAGFGGKTTALALHIETAPTHIAGMPVAVAICCHVSRHKKVIL